jgi:hypothetical protein
MPQSQRPKGAGGASRGQKEESRSLAMPVTQSSRRGKEKTESFMEQGTWKAIILQQRNTEEVLEYDTTPGTPPTVQSCAEDKR